MKFVKVPVDGGMQYVNLAAIVTVCNYDPGAVLRLSDGSAINIDITPAEFFRLPVIHMGE